MMIVQCDACNTKFKLDDAKVKDTGVRVRCTKCQHVFVVMPPQAQSPSDESPGKKETFDFSFKETEQEQKSGAADFNSFTKESFSPKQDEKEKPSWAGEGMDFTFEEKPKEEEKESDWNISGPSAQEEAPFTSEEKAEEPKPEEEKFEFKMGEEDVPPFEAEEKEPPSFAEHEKSAFTFGQDFPPSAPPEPEKTPFEIEPPPTEEEFVVSSKTTEEARSVAMETPAMAAPPKEEELVKEEFGGIDMSFEAPVEKRSSIIRRLTPLLVLVLLAAGGWLLYQNGGMGFLKGFFSQRAASKAAIDIIGLKGYYVGNPSAGQLFVIEGQLVSNSDESKEVEGIHGILFDKNGNQVRDAWVAPGRIIGQDELKTISIAELGKRFKDRKGTIPSKGTVPFMVVFHGIPGELGEFSVEVDL